MSPDLPSFPDAVLQFRSFLKSQDHDDSIAWIFRQDVVELGGQIYVRQPLRDEESLVEAMYEEGVERGLGVALQVFCWLDGRPLVYIWLPEDKTDAEYRMLSGLKMSVPTDLARRQASGVNSRLRWRWLSWQESRKEGYKWADDIPHRPTCPRQS